MYRQNPKTMPKLLTSPAKPVNKTLLSRHNSNFFFFLIRYEQSPSRGDGRQGLQFCLFVQLYLRRLTVCWYISIYLYLCMYVCSHRLARAHAHTHTHSHTHAGIRMVLPGSTQHNTSVHQHWLSLGDECTCPNTASPPLIASHHKYLL